MAACAAVRAECMARACRDVYVPTRGCLQSYAEQFDSSQHRLASVYLSQFPTGFLHIIRAARIWEGNSSVLHLNCNINKWDKSRHYKILKTTGLIIGRKLALSALMLLSLWYRCPMAARWNFVMFWSHLCFINYGKLINLDEFGCELD